MLARTLDSLAIECNSTDSAMDHGQLRIGLVVDRFLGRQWLSHLVDEIKRSAHAVISPVILFESDAEKSHRGRLPWLWRSWCALDRMVFASRKQQIPENSLSYNSGFAITEAGSPASLTAGLSAAALEILRRSNLDLVIQVGGADRLNNLHELSKYGLWWVPESCCGKTTPAWFWAMYEEHTVFETVIKACAPDAQESRILGRSFAATDRVSFQRNKDSQRRKVLELLVHKLAVLKRLRPQNLDSLTEQEIEIRGDSVGSYHPLPTNKDVADFIFRWASRATVRMVKRWLWREHWFIAYRRNRDVLPTSTDSMHDFHIVASAKDRFYADPFCIDRGGKSYLFFEDYPFDKGRGLISYVEIDSAGKCTQPEVALTREYHLSYPHVFEHDGEVYMVPESLECRRVDLYRATDFPRHWVLEKTLIDNIPAVDPTILFHDGKVWLFVSGVRNRQCINEELFLFFSDCLLGQWTPHPCNPIVSDVRRARPAGRIFVHNGAIIRPAQDCSHSYGRSIAFHRIDILSETAYHETPIATIGPEWRTGNLGTHTFNQSQSIQTVDGRVLISKYLHKASLSAGVTKLRASADKASLTFESDRGLQKLNSGEPVCAGDR